ncbi:MAG: hypothetical protein ACI9YE_003700 [Psychroserpens sp.]|jgi:hypothetical protein
MKQITSPIALVKTWIELLKLATDDETHIHAKRMLIGAFGSIKLAIMYAEDNGNIKGELHLTG